MSLKSRSVSGSDTPAPLSMHSNTSGYIIAATVLLLVAAFSALVSLAFWIRRRRDRHYAEKSATRYATSIHLREHIPILRRLIACLSPPLSRARTSISSAVPESWRAFAAEWLHDAHDDDEVRGARRNNDALATMSLSFHRGHPASASAPDLLHRGEEATPITMHEGIRDASIPNLAQDPEAGTGIGEFMPKPDPRGYKSAPTSIYGGERVRLREIPEETYRVVGPDEQSWKAEQLERVSTPALGLPIP